MPAHLRLRTLTLWLSALGLGAGCFGSSDMSSGQRTSDDADGPPGLIDLDEVPRTAEQCAVNPLRDPGRVVLHRLNGFEYDNTVRDLLGDASRPAREFPADDYGYGFDNIASVLSMAPLLVEKYDAAAEALVTAAWERESAGAGGVASTVRVEAETASATTGALSGTAWNLYSNGDLTSTVGIASAGTHRIQVRAWAQQAGPEMARMAVLVNNQVVTTLEVAATQAAPALYVHSLSLPAGNQTVGVRFTNDFTDAATGGDRNLFVDWFEVSRIVTAAPPADASTRVRICDPAVAGEGPCTRQMLERFARRAWRRPVQPAELDRLVSFIPLAKSHGDDWARGVQLAMHAVLLSPHFLFRVELDPDPNAPVVHRLDSHELAARLSYFLWSSMPDETLFRLAEEGTLQEDEILAAQVSRMLTDARSDALVKSFAGQWLHTRAVGELSRDPALYPGFDAALKSAMQEESERFFRAFLDEDRSFRDALSADFTFVNDRLAAHYGLPEPGTGTQLTRVSLPAGGARGGLLTQGAVLAVTSQPNRTSPVKRGKWVLAQLLCSDPPPPPPNVEADLSNVTAGATQREKLAIHRTNPACAACHSMMDPIGLGMENYDAVGRFRTAEGGQPIDASGALPDGKSFAGVQDLARIIQDDPKLAHCVTEKLFTYALGRGDLQNQLCTVHETAQRFADKGFRLRELLTAIVQSDAFRERRGEGGAP